jgi:hypothetical protein
MLSVKEKDVYVQLSVMICQLTGFFLNALFHNLILVKFTFRKPDKITDGLTRCDMTGLTRPAWCNKLQLRRPKKRPPFPGTFA